MKLIVSSLLLASLSTVAIADAVFFPAKVMIDQADAIAVVDIERVEQTVKRSSTWTYHQKATARVSRCIKGELPEQIDIFGEENFICAQTLYSRGTFLLFLNKHDDLWVGCNWGLGIRPIDGNNIEWFTDNSSAFGGITTQSLSSVLEELEMILENSAQHAP